MYCTIDDIKERLATETLVKLADTDEDGEPDTAVIEAAIADADAEIDTYLSNRYRVPLTTAPAIVKRLSAILAVDNLFARVPGLVSEEHRQRATDARTLLRYLANAEIDISQSPDALVRSFVASTTETVSPVFSRDIMENF